MDNLTLSDLQLINQLSGRNYTGNQLLSNASQEEKAQFQGVKAKLKAIAAFFATKYGEEFGPFSTEISPKYNPIALGGTRLHTVWSGIIKGIENKQYSAQISFVLSREEPCLNVGFYFGAASSRSLSAADRERLEKYLSNLGQNLSAFLVNSPGARNFYQELFDNGFQAIGSGQRMLPGEWVGHIAANPANSNIITKIYPNELGYIESSTIDSFVAQVMFLMKSIESNGGAKGVDTNKPLTPEQRAKLAERRTIIGHKGEVFVMNSERQKLSKLGLKAEGYPKHVALESMSYGYDILSKDEEGEDLFIEVKTTIRTREDLGSKRFFISKNEIETYKRNKERYRIYRVYNIDNEPSIEIIDFDVYRITPDGYIFEY